MPRPAIYVSDERLVRTLRTAPRSTTNQIVGYLREDFGLDVTLQQLKAQLLRLHEEGVLGRHDRRDNYPTQFNSPHYTWWVLD